MAFNGECDAELLSEVLWPDPDLMPDGWYDTLRRRLFLLRRALQPLGWTVANRPGYGWRLKPL